MLQNVLKNKQVWLFTITEQIKRRPQHQSVDNNRDHHHATFISRDASRDDFIIRCHACV